MEGPSIKNPEKLMFQQFHIDYYFSPSSVGDSLPKTSKEQEIKRVVCVFGRVTEEESICCHIHGYNPAVNQSTGYVGMFREEKHVTPFCWIVINSQAYRNRVNKVSTCSMEIDVNLEDVMIHAAKDEWARIIPFTMLCLDIECEPQEGRFVKPELDRILQISSVAIRYGESKPFLKAVFTLDSCEPLPDATVSSFASEHEMLLAWRKFVVDADPDIVAGHNVFNFDIYFLIERFKHLQLKTGCNIGRIMIGKTTWRPADYNNQVHWRQNRICAIEGRVILDVMLRAAVERVLPSYKLNYLSNYFISQQKDNVKLAEIRTLQNGDRFTRMKLAKYCLQDSMLVMNIILERKTLGKYISVALKNDMQFSEVVNCANYRLFEEKQSTNDLSILKFMQNKSPVKERAVTEKLVSKTLGTRRMFCFSAKTSASGKISPPMSEGGKSMNEVKKPSAAVNKIKQEIPRITKPGIRRIGLSRVAKKKK